MEMTRRSAVGLMAATALGQTPSRGIRKYVRYRRAGEESYGLLAGDRVEPILGDLFGSHRPGSGSFSLQDLKLLYPCRPSKVFAVGLNYKSHIGDRPAPTRPEIFYKPITALQHPGEPIVIPPDARNLHYEGELVLVIGRRLAKAGPEEAAAGIFGYTCGNDVSERDWQNGADKDLQWWRAKGADTFAPMGPCIVTGIDYAKAVLQTRLNGQVVQKQFLSDLLFGPPAIVSWISKYVTLEAGDVIYTGTPGTTKAMKAGDVVEVEIDGIGVLRNPVKAG